MPVYMPWTQEHSVLMEAIWAAVSAAPVALVPLVPADVLSVDVLAVVLVSDVPLVVPLAIVSVPVEAEPDVPLVSVPVVPEAIVSVPVEAEPDVLLVSVPVVPLAMVSVPVEAEPDVPLVSEPVVPLAMVSVPVDGVVAEPVVPLVPLAIVSVPVVAEPVVVPEPLALATVFWQSERTSACCSELSDSQPDLISSCDFSVPASKSVKKAVVMLESQSGSPPLIPVDGMVVALVPVVVSVDVWAIAAVPKLSENAVTAKILVIIGYSSLVGAALAAWGPNRLGKHVFQ
jgi:hypothetical protein